MQVITKTAAKFYGPHSGICLRPFSELNYRPSVGCPRHFPYNQFRRSFFCHRIGMTNEIILPVKVIGSIVPHSSIILISLNDQRTTSPGSTLFLLYPSKDLSPFSHGPPLLCSYCPILCSNSRTTRRDNNNPRAS